MSSIFVDTPSLVRDLLKAIETCPVDRPFLFVDLEGINLSRHGSISIMQILIPATGVVYLVDVVTLKAEAFDTASDSGLTLKKVLESETIPKVFFDVRNDSDALFSHFVISLQCVVDIQLLELVTRPGQGRYLRSLSKCVEENAGLARTELRQWQSIKEAGKKLFAPDKGGSYEMFNARPLPATLVQYCVQDVLLMPKLVLKFSALLSDTKASKVAQETTRRIQESQSASYQSHGRHKAIGPQFQNMR
ncbi:hypothetical protein PV10_07344 [Exophiala mesophila]|uniref:3'-5' exonuclease domain-containing protein n=1 Tax=Exophiala mesophila TaxID=212818 RepID=A0A0D1Z7S4_EXOME|nr:uncharacterized protein PV10_07344 [Exophiala mesophila]KIV89994.1 hypothetical protein PV10_07344 [Exophiala mesophila]